MKQRMTTQLRYGLMSCLLALPLGAGAQAVTPATGVPAVIATPFYQGVPNNATIPRVVPELCSPRPLQTNADPNLREIRITFDQPMDTALFYWPLPLNDAYFPLVTNNPYWVNNRTVVLPVQLSPSRIYSIPINSPNLVFRGQTGLYVNPGLFRFETAAGSSASIRGGVAGASAPSLQRSGSGARPSGGIGVSAGHVVNQSGAAPAAIGSTSTGGSAPARTGSGSIGLGGAQGVNQNTGSIGGSSSVNRRRPATAARTPGPGLTR